MLIDTDLPRAFPSGEAQIIALSGLALPEITGIVQISWKILTLFF